MTDEDHAYSSFGNGVYANPQLPFLPVEILYFPPPMPHRVVTGLKQ